MIYWVIVKKKKKNLIKRGKKCWIYKIVKISYYDLLGNSKKKKEIKEVKNANFI